MNEREAFYDEKISPLMTKIIALCKEGDIPVVASFELDNHGNDDEPDILLCTTIITTEAKDHKLLEAARLLDPDRTGMLALTEVITTKPDGTKEICIGRLRP